jgi:surface polysaccharide O-acyltransferase-like enzyme
MHFMGVNVWAALVAALATMVIGFLWYSLLFARPWMVLMGYDPDDKAKLAEMHKGGGPMYALALLASLLSAALLGKIIAIATVNTAVYGMKIGLAVWLGFVTTVQLTNAVFSKQPGKLYAINTGYQLVCYLVMGAILGAWR